MLIDGRKIGFTYECDGSEFAALKQINIQVQKGELVAILGRNGCGKSTLVKHFNALLPLQEGELRVAGIDVRDQREIWKLRRQCGMVFQNPDNQFVSSIVEEDIAFGLENYEVPREQIPALVQKALAKVKMRGYEKRSPHSLSGGQKQRVALAGVLALEPELLVLDEVTAMLDPDWRREVLATVQELHRAGTTILMITHYVEEAVHADRVLLMNEGKLLQAGTPRRILTDEALLKQAGLLPPLPVKLYNDLALAGIYLGHCPLTEEELAQEICRSL